MNLKNLIKPWTDLPIPDLEIKGLDNDSRKLQSGFLFIAYPGAASDGRLYVTQALQAGAIAILYEPEDLPSNWILPDNIIAVAIPKLAQKMAVIAARFYNNPSQKILVTGITGTNGKTTIAFQLAQAHAMLSTQSRYIGTLGEGEPFALNPLSNTTPDGLFLQKLFHDYQDQGVKQICMEVSSHALAQRRVDAIGFNQAIFTNLTHDHLDYHHTMEEYVKAKALLFKYPNLQHAIVNQDDPYVDQMSASINTNCQLIGYGLSDKAQVRALRWNVTLSGTEVELSSPWGKQILHIYALGFFNIYNALAIFTSLMVHGYAAQDVVEVMAKLKPAPGRMEIVHQKPCVLVDYAHTPDALENVLKTIGQVKEGKIITVFGCGGDRDKSKRPIMGKIAVTHSDMAIITNDNPRTEEPLQILQDIEQGIVDKSKVLTIADREEAITKALHLAGPEDIVIIAGKGHENYQQIGHTKYPFSDQEVVKAFAWV